MHLLAVLTIVTTFLWVATTGGEAKTLLTALQTLRHSRHKRTPDVTASPGDTIGSFGYPGYPAHIDWTAEVNGSPGLGVCLDFTVFGINNCCNDYVKIFTTNHGDYTVTSTGTYCFPFPPVDVRFHTDSSMNSAQGFIFRVSDQSTPAPTVTSPDTQYIPDSGQVYAAGFISMLGYSPNEQREWTITSPRGSITIAFGVFLTENNYDKLTIYNGIDGAVLYELSGQLHSGHSIYIELAQVNLRFTADGSNQFVGFQLAYYDGPADPWPAITMEPYWDDTSVEAMAAGIGAAAAALVLIVLIGVLCFVRSRATRMNASTANSSRHAGQTNRSQAGHPTAVHPLQTANYPIHSEAPHPTQQQIYPSQQYQGAGVLPPISEHNTVVTYTKPPGYSPQVYIEPPKDGDAVNVSNNPAPEGIYSEVDAGEPVAPVIAEPDP